MRLYRNSKFTLSLGFILILALMAAVAVIGITRMAAIKSRMDGIVNQQNVKTELVAAMHNAARERSISLHRMALMTDPFERDDEYLYFRQMAWDFVKARDALVKMRLSPVERAALENSQKATISASQIQEDIYLLIAEDKLAEANRRLLTEALPAQNKVLAQFSMFLNYQRQSAREAAQAAHREYQHGFYGMIVLSLLSIGFGTAIAFAVVRYTTRAERALFNEKERAEVTLHSIADAVISTDAMGLIEYMNPIAEQLTGWRLAQGRGRHIDTVFKVLNELNGAAMPSPLADRRQDALPLFLQPHGVLVSRDGSEYAIEESAAPLRDGQGGAIGYVVVFHDVTQSRHLAHQLSWQASHDALTGLANRREFESVMQQLWESAHAYNKHHALLYMDLDQFKIVNDTCGHAAGDELLRQLSVIIGAKVREGDSLFRIGGDEFAMLLTGCPVSRAEAIANEIRQAIEAFRFIWQDKSFVIGVSIGLVPITADSESMAQLLGAADAACYAAKEKGRNRVQVYAASDNDLALRQGEMQWLPRINLALEQNRFLLYYQKITPVRGADRALDLQYEVLLRMLDEQGKIVSPQAFIPAAERYNLMPGIDRWVVRNTLAWVASHAACLRGVSTVYINLSGQSLNDETFAPFVIEQLKSVGVLGVRIGFEITETAAIANLSRAMLFMNTLKALGCSFALDDFGSGMSSFAYLKNLPVDKIKIDGIFVRDILSDKIDCAMVEAINRIGHVMGIETVAEFVENDAILQKLKQIGVDYAQGYGLHMPAALSETESETETVALASAAGHGHEAH
jgi:diguanylate cyclase (GGDEF)-like protein/PAS domain S-box-containing protein